MLIELFKDDLRVFKASIPDFNPPPRMVRHESKIYKLIEGSNTQYQHIGITWPISDDDIIKGEQSV